MKRFLDGLIGIPLVYFLSWFKGAKGVADHPVKKVLVIKLAAAGDAILLASVLQKFRKAHPTAIIHWLVSPVNQALAKTVPGIDQVVLWKGDVGLGLLALIKALRSEHYDAVVDLEQWSRGTALISFFTGAPIRVGFQTRGQHRHFLFTKPVVKRFDRHEIHEFEEALSVLGPIEAVSSLQLWETDKGRYEADLLKKRLGKGKKQILLHVGCGADGTPREWPLENYALLIHWLRQRYDANIFLTGGPDETAKTHKLNLLVSKWCHNVAGQLTWEGTLSLIARMDLVISGNTGVMHAAAAFQKKQIALHGPTNPVIWGPVNPHAKVISSSCPQCPCLKLGFEYHAKDHSCMARIQIDTVKKAVMEFIDNNAEI